MIMIRNTLFGAAAALVLAAPVTAQSEMGPNTGNDTTAAKAAAPAQPVRPPVVFEPAKADPGAFDGLKLEIGAAFTQSFQSLSHENTARPVLAADGKTNVNQLADIGAGFNLASANLFLNAQLTPGIKVVLETYLSSRHHNEAWVKGGYLQIDESPLDLAPLNTAMKYLTMRVGHFEPNYGDALYRRTDGGNAIRNPFVENLILDAFTTEIGADVTARKGALLGSFGVTSGQNKGDITRPDERSYAFLGKVGVDQSLGEALRFRLTASTYQNDNAGRATLYGGDRAGSAYWGVLDNAAAKAFTNGRVNPNFSEEIRAYQINPFVQVGPVEIFGALEKANGRTIKETEKREVTQVAVDGLYRLFGGKVYVGGRYNTVSGELLQLGSEQTVDRKALAAGWFLSPNVLLKGEYVKQTYDGWADTSILNGGQFNGVVLQGVVAF